MLAIPLAALLAAFVLEKTPAFTRWADSDWLREFSVNYTLTDQRCEILVFGDSSAVTGIDADRLGARTDKKACNLAQTMGVINVLHFEVFDAFLRNNPRPQVLVLQFAAQDLHDPGDWSGGLYHVEGNLYDLRFEPFTRWGRDYLTHPDDDFTVLRQAYAGTWHVWSRRLADSPERVPYRPLNTHMLLPAMEMRSCADWIGLPQFPTVDPEWVRRLKQHFRAAADLVLVNVSPDTACNKGWMANRPALEALWHEGTLGGKPELYPVTLLNAPNVPHYTEEGAQRLTDETAAQILDAFKRSSDRPSARTP